MSMAGPAGAGHSGTAVNLLPPWLAMIWTVVFAAVVVSHSYHLIGADGERRTWHGVHVAMAAAMALMFAAAWAPGLTVVGGWWVPAFASGAAVIALVVLTRTLTARASNGLWLLLAADLGVMAYMGSSSMSTDVTWLLIVFCGVEAGLWLAGAYRRIDGRLQIRGAPRATVEPGGTVVVTGGSQAPPLMCHAHIKVSMTAMMLGMAYMLAAMQLMN